MRIPNVLSSLVDEGVVERVVRPLMSGKEAQVYLVVAGGRECVAKIYKEADHRTFKHRADYTEGRKVRNSRDQRAIQKRSQHGRSQDEAAWRSTEVDMIYRLRAAGVRVPEPYHFIDGVLIMELVTDAQGEPAARLGEIDFAPDEAKAIYERLLQDVVRMLCAGVVHGDLSDFNVLMAADGPVIIDFPQSVDPSMNQNARKLLLRDVDNLHRFYTRFVPDAQRAPYAEEMWALFESNQLTPETRLRGQYRASKKRTDVAAVMDFIGEVNEDERRRRRAQGRDPSGIPAPAPRRVEIRVNRRPGARPNPSVAPVHGRPAAPASGSARPAQPRAAAPANSGAPRAHEARGHAQPPPRGAPAQRPEIAARPARPRSATPQSAAARPAPAAERPAAASQRAEGQGAPRRRRRRRRRPAQAGVPCD
jgi:RIO kinase 1